jgi:hypothetical protein
VAIEIRGFVSLRFILILIHSLQVIIKLIIFANNFKNVTNINIPECICNKANTMSNKNQSFHTNNLFGAVLFLSFIVFSFINSSAQTKVDVNATGSNNGSSWANAYVNLQDAINNTPSGNTIWVAAGTYKPTLNPSSTSTNTRDYAFYLNKSLKIYGGFAGTETTLNQRDISANPVILSGDIGTVGDVTDNCYHVFIMSSLTSSAILDGFIIRNGNANANYNSTPGASQTSYISYDSKTIYQYAGGGIYIADSDVDIDNCIFIENSAKKFGGAGMFFGGHSGSSSTTATLDNCIVYNNSSDDKGGGFYSWRSLNNGNPMGTCNPVLTNVTICYNSSNNGGGGLFGKNAHWTIKNVLLWGNTRLNNNGASKSTINGSDLTIIGSGTITSSNCMTQLASTNYTSVNDNALTSATNMLYNQDPLFASSSDPDGVDNIWMTLDDGLVLNSSSPGVGAGTSTGAPSNDISGKARATSPSIGAYEGRTCKQSNSLPSAAATYTATYADTDGNYTCYCDDNRNLILGLNLTGTGAVVPTTGVSLQIGATTTTTYNNAGGIITNTDGGVVFNRKWNVSPTTQPTSDVTVLYPFTNTEYSAIQTALSSKGTTLSNANELQMFKLTSAGTFADPHANGATGIILNHGSSATTGNWVHSSHTNGTDHLATYKVSSFSGGGGGGGASGSPLPVDLIHFDVHATNNHSASLHWATASEINNSHFEIERSYDGRTFEMIDQIDGNGNCQHQIEYNYIDEGIHSFENTAFYRLKQVDFDGTSEYSDIRVVRFDAVGSGIDFSAYPNPLTNELSVMVSLSKGEAYQIGVTDLQGAKVCNENHTFTNGIHKLNTSEWNSGMYILQVATDKGSKYVKVMKE